MQAGGNRWQTHLLVLLVYTLLALVLTWPLVAHFGSHVPGDGADDPPLTWNLWWVRHALLNLQTNPFDCDYLFYPLGINLAFYTLTVLNGLLSIPLQATVDLLPASNILLLSSFVLSGYGAFLLSYYLLSTLQPPSGGTSTLQAPSYNPPPGEPPPSTLHPPSSKLQSLLPAFTAGLLYAFASSKLFYAALGQWNIASSQWIPFYVLYLFKMGDHPQRWRYPLLAALTLLFQAYAELTYATFLVLFTALWLVWRLALIARAGWQIRRRPGPDLQSAQSKHKLGKLARNLILTGFLFAVGLTPMLAMMIPDLRAEGNILVEGGGFADVFSADLLGFLVPTRHHPLFGSLVGHFDFDHTVGQHLYLGYSVLALALVGVVCCWRHSAARFWSVSALVFWFLTLGPRLRINGHDTGLPLPFALVARLPFFGGNRYPSRYSVLLTLSLAMLVALGVYRLLDRLAGGKGQEARSKRQEARGTLRGQEACCAGKGQLVSCFLLLASLLLFEHLSVPLPLSDMRVPPVYHALAAQMPADSALLDLPVAWRNGFRVTGTQHPIIMFEQYYQTAHGSRILAGNTSRNPPLKFQYFTEAPVINTLIALETGHPVDPAVVERDRALAAEVLRFFNVEAVVVHPKQTGPEVVRYVETTLPVERFYEDAETVAYRVELPPWPGVWTAEPGGELGRLSFAEGWGALGDEVVWAQRQAVRLLVPLDGQAQRMAFRAYTPAEGQQLRLEVNGQEVQRIDMAASWQGYEVTLPADTVHPGLNEVWLHFARLYPAGPAGAFPRAIGQTGLDAAANLVVQSAGQEVGDFGRIYVNGQEVSPNERGYNVAVIHPASGQVQQVASFDTHLDERASRSLAAFLRAVPPGQIVAVAAADEASRLLDQEAVDALRGLGAAGDLREKFRWGHALIGVQGASPGTALEALDWMRPVTLIVGIGATEPHLAAAFAPITFTAMPAP